MLTVALTGYYGGKIRMSYEISLLLPYECTTLVDAFGGSGAITINRPPRFRKAFLNEKNPEIFNMHWVMVDTAVRADFINRLKSTTYSKEAFDTALQYQRNHYQGLSHVEKAVQTFILLTQSFNSTMKSFRDFKADENLKNMQERYRKKIVYDLPRVANRYNGVTLFNEDAIDIINRYRHDETVVMTVDPPYLHNTRGKSATKVYGQNGEFEFQKEDHLLLLETLKDVRCKVLLFGYPDSLYDEILAQSTVNNWMRFTLKEVNKPGSKVIADETVWINFEPSKKAKREIIGLIELPNYQNSRVI